jgi:ribonuclease P protein component
LQVIASPKSLPEGLKPVNTLRHTFVKAERLCSIRLISALFENGNIFHNSLFKVVWSESPAEIPFPAQVAFSVTKRSFRHAVDRNLAKRRMREAYRKNKNILYEHLSVTDRYILVVIILKGNVIPDYKTVEKSITGVLTKLISLTSTSTVKC